MKTETKYFGEIEYDEEDVIRFPRGLFGFEDERRFLLLPFAGDGTLYCFQSVDTAGLAFVAMDPFTLDLSYEADIPDRELAPIQVEDGEPLHIYTLCGVRDPVSESTVNLRCPVLVNGEKRLAVQVILEESAYSMRHKLAEFGKQEAQPC